MIFGAGIITYKVDWAMSTESNLIEGKRKQKKNGGEWKKEILENNEQQYLADWHSLSLCININPSSKVEATWN